MISSFYYDAKIELLEFRPKITKRKLEELRVKIKGITNSDMMKMIMEHIASSNLRHLIVYKSANSDAICLFFNFSTKKDKILRHLKAIVGIKV